MADAAVVVILLMGLVSGLRRGFFKEAIAVLSILVATYVAIHVYGAAGPFAAERLSLPADAGYLVGGVGSWVAAYFVSVLVGRLLWKSLRGHGPLKRVEQVAGGAADAAAGPTRAGPVTMMLKPLPTRAGILYWFDKVLGALLGVGQALLLVLVALFAAMSLPLGRTGDLIRASNAYELFTSDVEPALATIPEVKVVRSIGDMSRLVEAVKERPERYERLRDNPAFERLESYEPLRALAEDRQIETAVEGKHYGELLKNPKVLALLRNREFLRRLSEVDWRKVREDLEKAEAAPPPPPPRRGPAPAAEPEPEPAPDTDTGEPGR